MHVGLMSRVGIISRQIIDSLLFFIHSDVAQKLPPSADRSASQRNVYKQMISRSLVTASWASRVRFQARTYEIASVDLVTRSGWDFMWMPH